MTGAPSVQQALSSHAGHWATYLFTLLLFLFGIGSIIYNYYFGETAVFEFSKSETARLLRRVLVIACEMLGAAAPQAKSV